MTKFEKYCLLIAILFLIATGLNILNLRNSAEQCRILTKEIKDTKEQPVKLEIKYLK